MQVIATCTAFSFAGHKPCRSNDTPRIANRITTGSRSCSLFSSHFHETSSVHTRSYRMLAFDGNAVQSPTIRNFPFLIYNNQKIVDSSMTVCVQITKNHLTTLHISDEKCSDFRSRTVFLEAYSQTVRQRGVARLVTGRGWKSRQLGAVRTGFF